jgi:phage-related protein
MINQKIPISQQFDAFELESRGIREFYKIEFASEDDATMYITPHNQYDWLDHTWETLPCKLSENSQNSTGEQSRPKFTVLNPAGIFSTWIESGKTDGAIITRYRALLSDLEAGVNAYTKNIWVLSKVVNLNKDVAVFELRSTIDGVNFSLPARSFYPPDFPTVSLR